MSGVFSFFVKHKGVTGAVIAASIIAGWYTFFHATPVSPYQTVIATPGILKQEVSVTGKVTAVDAVDLSFSVGGRIASTPAQVGDTVSRGDVLVSLEHADAAAAVAEAEGNRAAAEAALAGLKAGTRPEDVAIARANLAGSEQDLANAYKDVPDTLASAYANANDAVRTKLTTYFSNADSNSPELTFSSGNTQAASDAKNRRVAAGLELDQWESELAGVSAAASEVQFDAALIAATKHLGVVKSLLDAAFKAADTALTLPSGVSDKTTLEGYASTAITNTNTAIAAVNGAVQGIAAEKTTVTELSATLDLKLAGATPEDIAAQEAKVSSARAAVDAAKAALAKTYLYAPFAGTVTRQDAKVGQVVGQTVGTSLSLVSMMSKAGFQMEAYVPEADIAKVKEDDAARVTLDAYGEDVVFDARVAAINPAETVIEGVSTYKVTLVFENTPKPPRSGMTANIDIATAEKDNIIAVPARAVAERDGVKYVQILKTDGSVEERAVTTGLSGSDGRIEIASGVATGEEVITYTAQ